MLGAVSQCGSEAIAVTGDAGAALVSRIRAAFADVPYPGDDGLVPATLRRDLEREQIVKDFAGREWRDLDVGFLRGQADALLLLTADAFRFYLPAYMVAMVTEPEESDLVPAAVVLSLTPPDDSDDLNAWFAERVAGLSMAQRLTIRELLEYASTALGPLFPGGEPDRALEYWAREKR
jgi:Family of unknown function (DUF6714)